MKQLQKDIALRGLFYEKDGLLGVSGSTGFMSFEWCLEPLQGKQVKALIQHVADVDAALGSWGLGSCWWQGVGTCPYGHHKNPVAMLDWQATGVLSRDERKWFISGEENQKIPFLHMNGHICRVVVLAMPEERSVLDTELCGLSERVESMLEMVKLLKSKL